jgi:glycosyltransferase involved in cell wall biosynthesis
MTVQRRQQGGLDGRFADAAGPIGNAPRYRVTVVTAVLDRKVGLERTLASVTGQTYPEVEAIVIDGGSDDGTRDVLGRYADRLAYWVSEPDSGIAEAMNKGLAHATGDLVIFLHAEDRFVDEGALARAMARVDEIDSIWAFDILHGSDDSLVRCSPRAFDFRVRLKNPLPHQGVLCPMGVFRALGPFDPSLKIDMDYDFWLRAYLAGCRLKRVPQLLAIMDDSGVSSRRDWSALSARFGEERLVQARHARDSRWRWLYRIYWPLYLGYRRLRLALGV